MSDTGETLSKRRSSRVKKTPVKFTFENDNDTAEINKQRTVGRNRSKRGKMSVAYSSDEDLPSNSRDNCDDDDDDDDDIDIEVDKRKPTELYADDEDLNGASIYQFATPSRRGAMAQRAASIRRSELIGNLEKQSVSREKRCDVNETPRKRRVQRKPAEKQTGSTTSSESVSEDEDTYVPCENDESYTEDSNGADEDDEEEKEAENTLEKDSSDNCSDGETATKRMEKNSPVKNISSMKPRRSTRINYKDYHWKTDEYFEMQSSRALTSNRTLGRLANPRLDEEKVQSLLSKQSHVTKQHKKAIKTMSEDYRASYPMWYYAMEEGYSLLLYGLGSKRTIIEDFRKEILSDHPTLVVNGFFPGLTVKEILNGIIVNLLEVEHPPNPNQSLNFIEQILKENPDDRLYLIVHNIDGPMLQSSKAQDTLSQLAQIKNLSLIASIDHINAPLIWDSVRHSRYKFCWWDATTFLPYDVETSFQSSVMVKRNETLAFSSLVNVFLSLTTKARAIYIILVKNQIEHANDKTYPGMAFKDLYRNAREAFLSNSDVTLRTHLKEFLDHKLVRSKRNIDGAEYLNIPLDNSLLKQFLEQHEHAE